MTVAAWAEEEFAAVDLGDARLDARAAAVLSALGRRPNLSIPAACGGRAEMAAAYRFFDNEKVAFEQVLAPHVERTVERIAALSDGEGDGEGGVALLVQDTSEIDLTRPASAVAGAGALDGSDRRGVLLHALHAFTPGGTPLGTAWARCLNRVDGVSHAPAAEKRQRCRRTPIEDKESVRWLEGLRAARAVAARVPPGVRCVCVADSEGDIYECLAEPRVEAEARRARGEVEATATAAPVDWLIRACQDRAIKGESGGESGGGGGGGGGRHLRERAAATPALYEAELTVRGRQPMTVIERRGRRVARQTRRATVEVRAAAGLTLRPPWRHDRKLPPVRVNVVLASEVGTPPDGEPPVEWLLVTTLPVDTPALARRVVEHYCVRWNIEILFRTLKSGCRVERRRFEHVDRMLPCLAMYLIVAWRTLFACRMGRACPDADCEAVFEPSEWRAVYAATQGKRPPRKPPRLGEMVRLVARLGGYVERPKSEPGPQTVWVGLQRAYDLAWAWDTFGPDAKLKAT